MFLDYSIWDKLRNTSKPIFLYGTGNGGDKIIDALEAHGGVLTGVFASDGFVRDREFRGYKVRSYSDVVTEYGDDFIILLAFGTTLHSVVEFIRQLDAKHELIIPDVPLYGGTVFDYEYFLSQKENIESTLDLFADELSKQIFVDAINFRLGGKLSCLSKTATWSESLDELLGNQKFNCVLDGGAFKGDSTEEFIKALSPQKIYAVEADPKTFLKLSDFAQSYSNIVSPVNAALWNEDGELHYVSSGSRGSGESGRNRRAKEFSVPSSKIDTILENEASVDLIKLDIEGAELEALIGAETIIKRCSPNMIVSLYHKTDDIISLTQLIHALLPSHKLYLRRIDCIPFWDLNLYAVK